MKKLVLSLLGIFLLFSSCDRESISTINVEKQQIVRRTNFVDFHVVDNTIHFATQEDVYKLEMELSSLNQSQLNEWEALNHFYSFRRKYDEVTDSLIKIDDENHFFNFVESNKDVLMFEGETLKPVVSNTTLAKYANPNGEYYVGEEKYFVRGEKVFMCESNEILYDIYPNDKKIKAVADYGTRVSAFQENSGKSRKCDFEIVSGFEVCDVKDCGSVEFNHVINARVYNYKKVFGVWTPYKTACRVIDGAFEINTPFSTEAKYDDYCEYKDFDYHLVNGTFSKYSDPDNEVKTLEFQVFKGTILIRAKGIDIPIPPFVKIKGRASNRGLTNEGLWAIINNGY